jgi:hypothetical protein
VAERNTADILYDLLAVRHQADVVVRECKDGPTQSGTHRRMDAWVLKRSWAHPLTIGYEIKVVRSDFLKDDKWTDYLALCNEFYFVCPKKIIRPEELPAEAGLLVATTNLRRLYMKKKAPRRDIEIPDSLWRYIVMCRSCIDRKDAIEQTNTREFWRAWLVERRLDRELGRRVSRALRKVITGKICEVKTINDRLQKEVESLKEVRRFLERLGLSPRYCPENVVKRRLAGNEIVESAQWRVNSALRSLHRLRSELKTIMAEVAGRE